MQPVHPHEFLTFDFENFGHPQPTRAAALVERDRGLLNSRDLSDTRSDEFQMATCSSRKDGFER